jgi:hypothetical protein
MINLVFFLIISKKNIILYCFFFIFGWASKTALVTCCDGFAAIVP